jgi:hypothetical protein
MGGKGRVMTAFSAAIVSHLATAGLVDGGTGWASQQLIDASPSVKAVIVRETGGMEPEQATDRAWRRPSFQIEARAPTAKLAADKIGAVMAALDRAPVNGFGYFRASQSTPLYLGGDPWEFGERHRFVINFRAGES